MKHKCFLFPLSFEFIQFALKYYGSKIMYTYEVLMLVGLSFQTKGINKLLTDTAGELR